jgi:SHAQKYF class myb-like DNA-binding protein
MSVKRFQVISFLVDYAQSFALHSTQDGFYETVLRDRLPTEHAGFPPANAGDDAAPRPEHPSMAAMMDDHAQGHMAAMMDDQAQGHLEDSKPMHKPRVVWTDELHQRFLRAIDAAGSDEAAVPTVILKVWLVGVRCIWLAQVVYTATSDVVVNGIPADSSKHKKGRVVLCS